MPVLPAYGEWMLRRNIFNSDPSPFDFLRVNFETMTGSIRKMQNTVILPAIHPVGPTGFWAGYEFEGKRGRFEVAHVEDDGSIVVNFTLGPVKNDFRTNIIEINWTGRKQASPRVRGLPYAERFKEAIERALPLLPPGVREEVAKMITPEALATIVAITGVWAVSHFVGVGEVADIVLIIAGGAMFGATAFDIAGNLNKFAQHCLGATSEQDLDDAARHFADAVSVGGVNLISALLFRSFAKKPDADRPFRQLYRNELPYSPTTHTPLNRDKGRWFYRPRNRSSSEPGGPLGRTNVDGDTWVNSDRMSYPGNHSRHLEEAATFRHERFHQILTPKLHFLRERRVQLARGGYARSHILRYLEEALAECYGRYGTVGEPLRGLKFPMGDELVTVYATWSQMGREASGIVQGSIVVGGMVYYVAVSSGGRSKDIEYEYDDLSVVY